MALAAERSGLMQTDAQPSVVGLEGLVRTCGPGGRRGSTYTWGSQNGAGGGRVLPQSTLQSLKNNEPALSELQASVNRHLRGQVSVKLIKENVLLKG